MSSKEVVYLGIDLGTSRTSVTSSTGARETVWSYVGYPEDHVALRRFRDANPNPDPEIRGAPP